MLARLVRDEELARDLAQETFWKVYNRLDRFDTSRRFGPWLFRVGVNLGLDLLRRHDPMPTAALDRPAGRDGRQAFDLPDPDPRLRAELAQEVQFMLEKVPVLYRTILVLRDLEGFSSAEVAAIIGRREATVRWRLAKARELFRDLWERRQDASSEMTERWEDRWIMGIDIPRLGCRWVRDRLPLSGRGRARGLTAARWNGT